MKDLKELQEKSTIENIQFEIESGLTELAQKMQKFNEEVADWDDDNQKVCLYQGSYDWSQDNGRSTTERLTRTASKFFRASPSVDL